MKGEWHKVCGTYFKEFYKRENKIFIKIFLEKDKFYYYEVAPLSGFGCSENPNNRVKSDKSLTITKLEALTKAKEVGWGVNIKDHLKIANRNW